jgi:hypothetical protein
MKAFQVDLKHLGHEGGNSLHWFQLSSAALGYVHPCNPVVKASRYSAGLKPDVPSLSCGNTQNTHTGEVSC